MQVFTNKYQSIYVHKQLIFKQFVKSVYFQINVLKYFVYVSLRLFFCKTKISRLETLSLDIYSSSCCHQCTVYIELFFTFSGKFIVEPFSDEPYSRCILIYFLYRITNIVHCIHFELNLCTI